MGRVLTGRVRACIGGCFRRLAGWVVGCREADELGILVVRFDGEEVGRGREGAFDDAVAREGHQRHGRRRAVGAIELGVDAAQVGDEAEHARQARKRDLGGVDGACADDMCVRAGPGKLAGDRLGGRLDEYDAVGEAGGTDDAARAGHGVAGDIGGDDATYACTGLFSAGARLGKLVLPGQLVKRGPSEETPALAVEARSTLREDLRGFESDAAAGAAGVDEDGDGGSARGVVCGGSVACGGRCVGVAGGQDVGGVRVYVAGFGWGGRGAAIRGVRGGIRCGVRLLRCVRRHAHAARPFLGRAAGALADGLPTGLGEGEGCVVGAQDVRGLFTRCLGGQALEEGLAREVELQAGAVGADGERDAGVGALGVHVRARAAGAREPVADGVFHA